jgi:Flp pilus assembly protein TadD
LRAKLHSYRGAMAKRLRRFREAEADLLIAEGLAGREDRLADIDYNLAGVYAMSGRSEDALARLRRLAGTTMIQAVKAHEEDYFDNLGENPEFRALLAGVR